MQGENSFPIAIQSYKLFMDLPNYFPTFSEKKKDKKFARSNFSALLK